MPSRRPEMYAFPAFPRHVRAWVSRWMTIQINYGEASPESLSEIALRYPRNKFNSECRNTFSTPARQLRNAHTTNDHDGRNAYHETTYTHCEICLFNCARSAALGTFDTQWSLLGRNGYASVATRAGNVLLTFFQWDLYLLRLLLRLTACRGSPGSS